MTHRFTLLSVGKRILGRDLNGLSPQRTSRLCLEVKQYREISVSHQVRFLGRDMTTGSGWLSPPFLRDGGEMSTRVHETHGIDLEKKQVPGNYCESEII